MTKFQFYFLFLLTSLILFAAPQLVFAEPMTWQDCVEEAARNNPDLVSASEEIVQAKALKASLASDLFPGVTASASATETNTKLEGRKASSSDTYSYGLTGSLLLFDGFKSVNAVRAAEQNVVAAGAAWRFTSADVRWNLRTSFVNLLRAQNLTRVTEDIAHIRLDALKLISLRYKSGLEHKGALLNARAQLHQAKIEVVQAARNLKLAEIALNTAMGRSAYDSIRAVEGLKPVAVGPIPDIRAIANNHPSVVVAKAREKAADFSLKSTRGNYYPEVSLQAQARKTGENFLPKDRGLNAQVVVSLPLFEGGSRKAQLAEAKSLLRQSSADLHSAFDAIVLELEQGWNDFRDAAENVKVREEKLAADEERAKIAETQYSTGFISYDNWSIIQDNLVQSKKAYLDALANAMLARARWILAKGETLEYAEQ